MTNSSGLPVLYLLLGAGAFVLFLILGVIALIQAIRKATAVWIILACACLFGCGGVVAGGVFWAVQKNVFGELAKGMSQRKVFSDDGSMEATVPFLWTPMPNLNAQSSFSYGNRLAEEYMMVIVNSKVDIKSNLGDRIKLVTERLKGASENATLGQIESLTVDQQPAMQRKIEARSQGVDVVYKYTVVEEPDTFVSIVCWTVPRFESDAFKKFDQMLATFHVTGKLTPKAPGLKPEAAPMRVVFSKHKRIQISVPNDWKEYAKLNPGADLAYVNGEREEYFMIIDEPKTEFPGGMTLERYAQAIAKVGLPAKADLGELKSITINGQPALQRRLTATVKNISAVYQSTCVEFPTSFLHVLCWTLPTHEATAFPTYEKVLATLKPAPDAN